jgi:uncharacterized protein (DUF2249 family)/quercetin dioxygenase-like cupin family protein
MRVTGPDQAPARRRPGAAGLRVRVLAGAATEPPSRTGLIEIDLAPGAALPPHAHGDAEAVVYVVAGRARVSSEGRDEEVVGGAAIQLDVGTEVEVVNPGPDRLRLLVAFAPAGFEDRFLGWEEASDDAALVPLRPQAVLNLTGLPRRQRHGTVIGALEALDAGTRLVIVNDHEPNGLHTQLERRYGPRLGWDVRERAGDHVAVAIWLDRASESAA